MWKTYQTITNEECGLCDKKAEVLFLHEGFFTFKVRFFCKSCAKTHQTIQKN